MGQEQENNNLFSTTSMLENPTRSLTAILDNTAKLMTRCVEMELKTYEISFAKLRVISLLSAVNDTGATLQELSRWTFRELNSVSVLIRSMEKDGLVKKVTTPYKVSNRYYLTELGHKMKDSLGEGTKATGMFFSCLTQEEEQVLRTILMKLQHQAEEMLKINYIPPFLE